uniref:Uncharacterized protein n=1 Tax=Anguilla anguilla TaxID=7936 RepID=A0A0E9P9D0_ANGAN
MLVFITRCSVVQVSSQYATVFDVFHCTFTKIDWPIYR